MNMYGKMMLAVSAAAMMVAGSGCGNHNTTTAVTTPTIVVVNGYRGYYVNNVFCDWANNYCGTGNAYGIAVPVVIYSGGYYGYYDNSVFCDWTNDYCGTGISWGIIDNGTYCDYTYCGGTVGWSSGSTGTVGSTGGSYSGSTGGSYSGSTGGSYSGSTGGSYSGSTGGSYTGSTGGSYTGSTGGSYSGSTGGSYTGSTGGSYTGSTGGSYTGSTGGSYTGSTGGSTTTSGSTGTTSGYAVTNNTKDVDLQRAQLQIANIESRAQALAQQFGMSVQSAVQVTQLADRMSALTSGGKQMTAEDQAALLDAAYGVAGVSGDQVNTAAQKMIKNGDQSAVNDLLNQAAAHMGMSSTTALRDQILPSLGINLK